VAGRGRIYAFFWLSDLKEMIKDLGNYTDNPDQYIQDVMLLLDQTLTSLEKQRVLAQAT
jgi:hypothetical protein